MDDVLVRPFDPSEWRRYRTVRLRALQVDPTWFSSSYAIEVERSDAQWLEALTDADLGIFGVFVEGEVIGMTGVAVSREDRSSGALWGSWLEPEWRRHGLSERMYAVRIAWARAHPALQRITVSHRTGNVASERANQKHGFVFTHTADRLWRDGITEPEVCYALVL